MKSDESTFLFLSAFSKFRGFSCKFSRNEVLIRPAKRIGCMGRYDISSKVLFKDYERDFVTLTLKDRDFEIIGTIPTEFPSVQMRMMDAPVKVRIGDEEAIVP